MAISTSFRLGLLFALSGVAVASCISPPDYPDTPQIDFQSLEILRQPTPAGNAPADSIIIAVNFKDGDGDLGLSPEEYSTTSPPYNRENPDKTLNINHWNYYLKLFVKNPTTGQFEPYTVTPDNLTISPELYYGQFPHLEPNPDKKAPLKGTLRFKKLFVLGAPFYPGQEARFEVTIRDRALNLSNTATTNSFIVTR